MPTHRITTLAPINKKGDYFLINISVYRLDISRSIDGNITNRAIDTPSGRPKAIRHLVQRKLHLVASIGIYRDPQNYRYEWRD